MENPVPRYLDDAIAAEKSFETQLRTFAEEAAESAVSRAFRTHADETREQYEALTQQLKTFGREPSTMKSAMAHFFSRTSKAAQTGHDAEERTTEDLIIAYSAENAEVALYEGLIIAAQARSDDQTATLARQIQSQERETAGKVWMFIAPSAARACRALKSHESRNPLIRYVQDAETAERNLENALGRFSQAGDQTEVRSLMSMMSSRAKTQHERLERRLRELGGGPSTAKSALAHMLSFTPVSVRPGHLPAEKSAQHLMIAFAAVAAGMGMYEALASAAEAARDEQTLTLARELQAEEREDQTLAWDRLRESARAATAAVVAH